MKLTSFMNDNGRDAYYTVAYRQMLEMHLPYLRNHTNSYQKKIEDKLCHRFEANFYGLLSELNYESRYHWCILRINYLHSPIDYQSNLTTLTLPPFSEIDRLYQLHTTVQRAL